MKRQRILTLIMTLVMAVSAVGVYIIADADVIEETYTVKYYISENTADNNSENTADNNSENSEEYYIRTYKIENGANSVTIEKPKFIPVEDDKEFAYWSTSNTDDAVDFFGNETNEKTVSSDEFDENNELSLYAHFEEKQQDYKIKYLFTGGEGNGKYTYSYNSSTDSISIPNPKRDGYTFKKWECNNENVDVTKDKDNYYIAEVKENKGDLIFAAVWDKDSGNPAQTTYKVTFKIPENNGGWTEWTPTDDVSAKPEKENFDFEGWYTDSDLKTRFEESTEINQDITLYANFTEVPLETSKLLATIETAKKIKKDNYTDDSYTKLTDIISEIVDEEGKIKENKEQADIDNAIKAINNAIDGLQQKPIPTNNSTSNPTSNPTSEPAQIKTVEKIKEKTLSVIKPLRKYSCHSLKNKKNKKIKVTFNGAKGKSYFLTVTDDKGRFVKPVKKVAKKTGKKVTVNITMKKSKTYIVQVYEKTSTKSGGIKRIQCIGATRLKYKK